MNWPARHHDRRGFTLLEIMFSIMILGVGMIAVAGMFPVAAHIQQNTIEDMMAQETAANATAILRARGIDAANVGTALAEVPLHKAPPDDMTDFTHLEEHSYPSSIPDVKKRLYFWRLMARKQGSSMEAFIVVMKRHGQDPSDGKTIRVFTVGGIPLRN